MKFRFSDYQNLIDPTGVNELKKITVTDSCLIIGSCVTLAELQQFLVEFIPTVPGMLLCCIATCLMTKFAFQKQKLECFALSEPCCIGLLENTSETRL